MSVTIPVYKAVAPLIDIFNLGFENKNFVMIKEVAGISSST